MEDFNITQEQYAIYLRKSRADIELEQKGEGETLARHKKILTDLALKNQMKIGKIYKEIVSGETIEARPEVQKLLSDVREGKWKGVLVVEVERLARGETMDQGIVAKAFKISNTKIITPFKIYDPNNEFDEEYFEFGLFMSRREYKTINRRLKQGRESSAREGKYVGSIAPFGYDKVKIKNDKGYTLIKNREALTVKIIYDLYAYNNLSLYEIEKRINEMNLKPRINDKWSITSIKDILSNPVYIGKIKWNCRKVVKVYKNERLLITRPRNNNYILVDGLHEPIIDEKTWNIVQEKREKNNVPVTHTHEIKNPLCGIIICGKCGKKMKRKPCSNNNSIIYCDNRNCDNISSKLSIVEEKVVTALKKCFENYKFDYKNYIEKINNNKIKTLNETIEALKKEMQLEKSKLIKIYDFLEDGIYSREMFSKRYNVISTNIGKINNSISEYKKQLDFEIRKNDYCSSKF